MLAATLTVGVMAGLSAGAHGPEVRDLDGGVHRPFEPSGHVSVLLFTTSDCPVANGYAPEMARACRVSAARGVSCLLVYEDSGIAAAAARHHRTEYGLGAIAAALDADRAVAAAAGATVTPEAVVMDGRGVIRYRGRIDNTYAALGRRRIAPTTHDLSDAIDAVLAGRPVTQPATEAFGCFISPASREQVSR
jgi:hypothetical protein